MSRPGVLSTAYFDDVLTKSLLVTGTEGFEAACDPYADAFSRTSQALGARSEHRTIVGRDHMTVLANIALAGDPARVAMLEFMRPA